MLKSLLILILINAYYGGYGQIKAPTANLTKTRNHFKKDSAFQIITSYRSITTQSSAPDTNMCKGWSISKKNLYSIIKHSKPIGGTEWDLVFDVLPCIVKGQLKQKGELYNFELNGGAWFYLSSKDTTVIFGDYDRNDEKYFIDGPMRN